MSKSGFHSMNYYGPNLHVPRPEHYFLKLKCRFQRPQVDLSEIYKISSEYDFELVRKPQSLPNRGSRGQTLLLYTSCGKKIFKRYKHTVKIPAILHEHSLIAFLNTIDFPTTRLFPTHSGRTWIQKNGKRYALFDFVEHGHNYRKYILSPGQIGQIITSAGKLLASLHHKLTDFIPQGYNLNGFKSQNGDRWRDLHWYINKLMHCIEETSRLNMNAKAIQPGSLLKHAPSIEKALVQLDCMLTEAGLPRLVIHGDYTPGNLLLRQNAPIIVLDFELSRLDWRAVELVDAMWRFGYNRFRGFNINRMKLFLDAYQSRIPLSQSEIIALPAVWQFLHIRRFIKNWHDYCCTHNESRLAEALNNLKIVNWMTMNQSKLFSSLQTSNINLGIDTPIFLGGLSHQR